MAENEQEGRKLFKNDLTGYPALHLVLQGVIGGVIGAIAGTWIYPDLGTLLGATMGIVGGVIYGEIVENTQQVQNDDPALTLTVSKRARAFFNSIREKKFNPKILPPTRKVKKIDEVSAAHGQAYKLHLFDQAVTSRGTGVFPHRRSATQRNKTPDKDPPEGS